LRFVDKECIEANSKTLYNLACIIEHEVLLRLCDAASLDSKEKGLAHIEKILQKLVNLSLQGFSYFQSQLTQL